MANSLEFHSVFSAAYTIAIRGAEFPDAEIQGMLFEPEVKGGRGRDEDEDDY